MMKPLAIDLFCGLHGWSEGLVAEGWRVVGFDIHDMCAQLGQPRPEHVQLVLQDVSTIVGRQFKDADLIVASPPCQAYSYRAMPWRRAKALPPPSNELFDACFRIQREAIEAAGRFIPMVVENVRGAQPWVGPSRWNYGSYHLWGDVPALMPHAGSASGIKKIDFDASGTALLREIGRSNFGWSGAMNKAGSKSDARKIASAVIAKIPLPLSRHIAAYWDPRRAT